MRSGIVCSGVSCLDLFLYGTSPLPTRESLSMVRNTQYRPGGATSNTGRALARLGMPVSYLTVLGNDANGDIMESMWRADGIDTSFVVRVDSVGTALSTIPVYEDGKRGVYFCPGTNDIMNADNLFGPERQYLEMLEECQAFHIGYPPLLRQLQGENLAELLRLVRATGVFVSLDTTPVTTDSELMAMLGPALPLAHMFTPNVMEAAQAAGRFDALNARANGADLESYITAEELEEIGDILLATGLPIVVITLGSNGVYIRTADEATMRTVPCAPAMVSGWANQRLFIPSFLVKGPVNTTGAGDSFTAGILTGICKGIESMAEIARLAHCAAALHVDLSRGIHGFEEVRAALPTMVVNLPQNLALHALI